MTFDQLRLRGRFRRYEADHFERRHALTVQDDLAVANAAGSAVRADITSQLQALGTLMDGTSAPSTTYKSMFWADRTSNTLKRRNAANSGWIVVCSLDEVVVLTRSSNTILALSDWGKLIICTSGFTQTVSAVSGLPDGWHVNFRVESGATLVIDPNSSETVNGATTGSFAGPTSGTLWSNGSAFYTTGFLTGADVASSITTLMTPQASTSGTSIDFTSIPAGVNTIRIGFKGVSTNGTSIPMVQIGDSGGIETSGYNGAAVQLLSGPSVTGSQFSAGFQLAAGWSATSVMNGFVELTRYDASGTWMVGFSLGRSDTAVVNSGGGYKTLSTATLDRVRITTVNGTDAFDAGEISVTYSFG